MALIETIIAVAAAVAEGATKGALRVWAEVGPQLVQSTALAWRQAMTPTVTEAPPVPVDLQDALKTELTDAMDAVDRDVAGK